jgi:uncharacterized membrane protein
MTRRKLLASLDQGRIEEAIRRTEAVCTIELRVSIAGLFWGDCEALARRAFQRLGMAATSGRNGLLVLLVPWRRKVVIFADQGITQKVDAGLWSGTVADLTGAFHDGKFTEGVVNALESLGRALAPHFPVTTARPNELPDRLDH